MARLKRICLSGIPQHIIQRGNNREACFLSEADFAAYAHWLNKYSKEYRVAIHAWVFMTNHVHLLVTPETKDGVSKMMQSLGRRYVRYFSYTHERTGTLWEGRFKSCVIDAEDYLFICQRYIELNPVRAKMVDKPEDYAWSSFKVNALGQKATLWTPHSSYQALGKSPTERANRYKAMFVWQLESVTLLKVRQSLNQGMVLGDCEFKQQIERLSGRRTIPLARGPRVKSGVK